MLEGIVYLVGAGPGDPGLLTVRARELIAGADAIVYDYLVNDRIIADAREDCERIYVGKRPHFHAIPQDEIEDILVEQARKGRRVVRLKGGDPFVFGRGGEEAKRLFEDGIAFEIVPGVTSALAAAAYAGIPLTHRDFASSLSFLTGHENPDKEAFRVDFEAFAKVGGTLCIYMGMGHLPEILEKLRSGGIAADTPVAIVQWATLGRQRSASGTLVTIELRAAEAGLTSPAIVFVGECARFSDTLGWFARKPLLGRRVVVSRSSHQAGELARKLEAAGAEALEIPLIEVRKEFDPDRVSAVFSELWQYEWMIFTSANGVRFFFETFFSAFDDLRALGGVKIACVGESTAKAVRAFNLKVDVVPENADAESLADTLIENESLDNHKIVIITGNLNSDTLPKRLEDAFAIVDVLPLYVTLKTDLREHTAAESFRQHGADAIVFASSSAVGSFAGQADSLRLESGATRPKACSIGPKTSEALRTAGLPVDIEAKTASLDSVVDALVEAFAND